MNAVIPHLELWQYLLIATLTYIISISWHLPFILLRPFKWQIYVLDNSDSKYLQNKLNICGTLQDTSANIPYGIFWGKWYIGIIDINLMAFSKTEMRMTILYQTRFFKKLMDEKNMIVVKPETKSFLGENGDLYDIAALEDEKQEQQPEQQKIIKIFETSGSYYDTKYKSRNINITRFTATLKQQAIIDSTITLYKKKFNTVVLITGPPGSGKSICAILLAAQLRASYCATFNPTLPSESIINLYNNICPTEQNPLVLLLDEIDIMIDSIHNDKIKISQQTARIQIYNKTTWNRFFDDIDNGLYPYVIFLMTSNVHKTEIDKIDPAYFRKGRIDAHFELIKEE